MSEEDVQVITNLSQDGAAKLKALVNRIENLETEKEGITSDIKDVYNDAKAAGFESKIIREIIRLRKKDKQEREEEDQIRDLYLHALGEI